MHEFVPGEVLVADMTDPDWEPIMKRAAAIVTDRGGRTCHAAIIARELGIPAVVGTGSATGTLRDGEEVTVSAAEGDTGYVYAGRLPVTVTTELGFPDTWGTFTTASAYAATSCVPFAAMRRLPSGVPPPPPFS